MMEKSEISSLLFSAVQHQNGSLLDDLLCGDGIQLIDSFDKDGNTLLHLAVARNDLMCVAILLKHGANPNIFDTMKARTPMHLATELGNNDLVKMILEKSQVNLNIRDDRNLSPEEIAQFCDNQTILTLIRAKQKEIYDSRRNLYALLDEACTKNELTQFKNILDEHRKSFLEKEPKSQEATIIADACIKDLINWSPNNTVTLLFKAASLGHTQLCKLLIESGATAKCIPTTNYSPLYVATFGGFTETMQLLIDNFPTHVQQTTIEKWMPLHIACIKNHCEAIKLLLNYPYPEKLKNIFVSRSGLYEYRFAFDLNTQDEAGQTVIYLAALKNNQKMLDTLLQFRLPAKLRLQSQSNSKITSHNTSKDHVKEFSSHNKLRHVRIVQNNSVAKDDRNQFVPNKQLDKIIRRLHKLDDTEKANNNCKDANRSTCLICPFEIDTYCNYNSESALHVAVCKQYYSIASTLLVNGANPNLPILSKENIKGDNSGPTLNESVPPSRSKKSDAGLNWFKSAKSTCLREACRRHDVKMVELLIKYGARDDDNVALQTAAADDDVLLLSKLLALGAYIDPEYKINRRSNIEFHKTTHSGKPSSTVTTFSSMFPTSPVMIDWHGLKFLRHINSQWLIDAALSHNKKLSLNHQNVSIAAITRLDLSGNNLKSINPMIFQLPSLRELNLSQNKLEILPVEFNLLNINEEVQENQNDNANAKSLAMKRSKSLTSTLSANTLPTTSTYTWDLPCLELLDLHDNRLTSLPLCLFQLPKLSDLDVSSNQIRQLPWTLWTAPLLREFNASGNLLHDLPQRYTPRQNPTEYQQARLSRTIADNSKRSSTSGDDSVSRFYDPDTRGIIKSESAFSIVNSEESKLITSDVQINHLNYWSSKVDVVSSLMPIGSPTNPNSTDCDNSKNTYRYECKLNHINLSFNSFTSIPPVLACVATELVRLNLSHNRMESLGNIHEYPPSLKNLDLSSNQISSWFTIPDTVDNSSETNCYNNEAYLDFNSSGSPIGKTQFSVLNVQSSYLKGYCIHKFHERLENLKSLNLSHNRLKVIAVSSLDIVHSSSEQSSRSQQQKESKHNLLFPHLTILDMSFNSLVKVNNNISELADLSVLNLSGNPSVCTLPPEMGLLSKLWNLGLHGCNLGHPLKSMIDSKSYKTMDIVGYLRSILEEAKSYARMKLMLVGIQGIGKTSLLEQIRYEGTISNKKRTPPEHWTKRMGHGSHNMKTPKGVTLSTVGVDIHDWVFCKKVARGQTTYGPVTFSTWDFGGQQEFYATHRYFLSKRSMYLVVWRLTDGESGVDGIQQWLVNIQSRAPSSPVIIVGTHEDLIIGGEQGDRVAELQAQIKQRFINIVDQDKCGFPKIVDSIVVSTKTRLNIRNLCNKIYDTVFSLRCPGSMERLLEQKIPATYLYLEEIVVWLANERRKLRKDPVMFYDEYKTTVVGLMRNKYQKSFRDLEPLSSREINYNSELQQATRFLHENGILLHYEDANLRDLYFLDPQWLCDILSHVVTIREINPYAKNGLMKMDDLNYLFKSVDVNLSGGIQSYIVNLLNKFEVALTWNSRYLLLPSLLPSENDLLNGVTPCEIKLSSRVRGRSAIRRWHPSQKNRSASIDSSKYHQLNQQISKTIVNVEQQPDRSLYRLIMLRYLPAGFFARLQSCILSDMGINDIVSSLFMDIPEELAKDPVISSITGSSSSWTCWQSGLCLHLDCQSLSSTGKVAYLQNNSSNFILRIRESSLYHKDANCDTSIWASGNRARYMIYSNHGQPATTTNGTEWCEYDPRQFTSIVEVHLPSWRLAIKRQDGGESATFDYIELNAQCIAKLMSTIVDHIDNLLEDWYPSLGTRFVHTSEGKYLVTRIVPCPQCEYEFRNHEQQQQPQPQRTTATTKQQQQQIRFNITSMSNGGGDDASVSVAKINSNKTQGTVRMIHCFYVEQCILCAYNIEMAQTQTSMRSSMIGSKKISVKCCLKCPNHGELPLTRIAPDIVFCDVGSQYLIDGESVHRYKLIGRGAYGLVFRGTLHNNNLSASISGDNNQEKQPVQMRSSPEIAMKMLQPVDPGPDADQADLVAYKSSKTNWQREPLQCACKAYCTARQELNILLTLHHPHIVPFVGLSIRPLAVILELAPFGSLEDIFKGYRRAGMRINAFCMQKIILQVARALEYLHQQRVIYRDLKSENVLVWDFPSPFATRSTSSNVNVKLADYGISRLALPTGIKGFGGTIGFLAPEILRHNGDEEYTEKVDCFSFGMFIYELITLHPPFDHHLDSIKGHVIDGGRPSLSPRDLIYPSYLIDLMTVCWSQEPSNRPTASQIVSIASCPEFVQMQDVVALEGRNQSLLHGVAMQIMEQDDMKLELWLTRQFNKTDILRANQSQWFNYKQLQLNKSFNFQNTKSKSSNQFLVTCTCIVEDQLWLCDARMTVHIVDLNQYHQPAQSAALSSNQLNNSADIDLSCINFNNSSNSNRSSVVNSSSNNRPSLNLIDSFSLDMIKSDIMMSSVQSMHYVKQANSVVLLTNYGQLWICHVSTMNTRRLDDGSVTYLCVTIQEPFITTTNDDITKSSAGRNQKQQQQQPTVSSFNIWCGHNNAISCLEIVDNEIARESILPLAGNMPNVDLSGERIVEPSQPTDIRFILAGSDNNLWTVAGCTVHLWSHKDRCVARKLDCWKLVPCSESLDSISIENHHDEARHSRVSSIAKLNNQLYVGTSHGCLMLVEANTLKPITVFRPFEADVNILVPTMRYNNWIDSLSNPDSGIESSRDGNISGVTLLDNNNQNEIKYIVTIGSQYRNVINRYLTSLDTEQQVSNRMGLGCDAAILWSANNWMID